MGALSTEAYRRPLHPTAEHFFARAVTILEGSGIPFLVGGGYAMRELTGVCRRTKDLDVFVRPEDTSAVLDCFTREGYATELTDRDWLAKVFSEEHFIDVIFSSGNVIATVDDAWFGHALRAPIFGHDLLVVPPEEMIWSKAFVMERERFDGADVAHLMLRCGPTLDWTRLLERMDDHWELLFAYLLYFEFVYPEEKDIVPEWLLLELERRHRERRRYAPSGGPRISRGPLVSRKEFVVDRTEWGYENPERADRHLGPLPARKG